MENYVNVPGGNILTIEWDMLDKRRFYPYFTLCSLLSRVAIYPNQLIRTRLQLQHHKDQYKGTADAYRKIVTKEGMSGLYRGFWFGTLYLVPGLTFVTTYERTRHLLEVNGVSDTRVKAMIGGGFAAAVSQAMLVPLDMISQRLMVQGMSSKTKTNTVNSVEVIKNIYRRDGCKGFYRGYNMTLLVSVPSSASWWTFYHVYQDVFGDSVQPLLHYSSLPTSLHHSAVQGLAGVAASCTTSTLLNPVDLVRARVQLERRSVWGTFTHLWRTERWAIFHKGLSARMISATIANFFVICGYETVKKISVYEELSEKVLW